MSWIIKLTCPVSDTKSEVLYVLRPGGRINGAPCKERGQAHQWHYKADAKKETIWWMGTLNQRPLQIDVEKA